VDADDELGDRVNELGDGDSGVAFRVDEGGDGDDELG
jgi:hypothetical protein